MRYKLIGENDYLFNMKEVIGANRGVEDIDALLSASADDCFSWRLLDNMDTAVETVLKHCRNNSRIHIIVD